MYDISNELLQTKKYASIIPLCKTVHFPDEKSRA